jgi:peptidoglycan/xylan/chitin deacetylase (PgdA/CDA1 family)
MSSTPASSSMVPGHGKNARSQRRIRRLADAVLAWSPLQPIAQVLNLNRLRVFAYHGVDDPEAFSRHLDYIAHGTHPVALRTVIGALHQGVRLPDRAALLTFDDGDRSVIQVALPMLVERQIPAVAFVISGLIGTDEPFWWNEVEELTRAGAEIPDLPPASEAAIGILKRLPDERRVALIEMLRSQRPELSPSGDQLTSSDLQQLVSMGVDVASHGLTHAVLPQCTDEVVEREVVEAHQRLSQALGSAPLAFAYPGGEWDPRAESLLRTLGYEAAFLFDHRMTPVPSRDPLRLSRLRVGASDSVNRLRIVTSGLHPAVHRLRGQK